MNIVNMRTLLINYTDVPGKREIFHQLLQVIKIASTATTIDPKNYFVSEILYHCFCYRISTPIEDKEVSPPFPSFSASLNKAQDENRDGWGK